MKEEVSVQKLVDDINLVEERIQATPIRKVGVLRA
jgi:hypothetical protein